MRRADGRSARQSVEDMDLAVRASLKGWKFLYIGDLKATFIGLLEAGRVNEWVVTEKLGDALKTKLGVASTKAPKRPRLLRVTEAILSNIFMIWASWSRIHTAEIAVGAYLFLCGCYDTAFGRNHYFIYLFLQAFAFFIAAFGYVGTFVPTSS